MAADAELIADLAVAQPAGDEAQDLHLPPRQPVRRRLGRRPTRRIRLSARIGLELLDLLLEPRLLLVVLLNHLGIGRRAHGYVALYRYAEKIDTVFVLALRSQCEAGYARN